MNNLVIVESPTKARTLSKFLGNKYKIEASMGHLVDLPKSELGVDISNDFEPKYIIPRDKKKRANEIKKLAKGVKTVWLATDPDREGEAIAWHLEQMIGEKNKDGELFKRVVFHEITEDAIKAAFEHPRSIDLKLVDAQQARRVLDRLVGYKLSPLLWKKVKRGLSAGRVQTVALRLVVEREREISTFLPIEYWGIEVEVQKIGTDERFIIFLVQINGEKIGIGEGQKNLLNDGTEAQKHLENLQKASFRVSKVTQKQVKRFPAAPFTTSTLQQTAGNRLGFSAKKTMMIAQNLYEQGFITYMRTDSVTLASQAVFAARDWVQEAFGKNYLPTSPRMFKSKSKNTQEAHEAIRPTNISHQSSAISHQSGFTKDHVRLYDLIWKRTVASQMADVVLDQTTIEVKADQYLLKATGSIIKFDGWLKLYGMTQLEEESEDEGLKKQVLPQVTEGENLNKLQVIPGQHFTQAPPRYTEASLIKKLEELGIGRPSTYAPILSTVQERFYVEKQERKFIPTALGFAVSDFLIKYFPDVFDYTFTAQMEDQLDDISRGERSWRETIKSFYNPLAGKLEKTEQQAEHVKLPVEVSDKKCPKCGKQLIVRTGRFGKFLACSGFPDCKHTESLEEIIDAKCPEDGGEIVVRRTKKGRVFYGCKNYPKCKFASWTKPKTK